MDRRLALLPALLVLVPVATGQSFPWREPLLFSGTYLNGVEIGHADGDGHPDLFVKSLLFESLRILRGNGDGSFNGNFVPVTTGVGGFALADLNADGLDDIVSFDSSLSVVSVRLAAGGAVYGAPVTVPTSGLGNSLAIDDLDGDGHVDLVLGLKDGNHVWLALGAGDGTFVAVADAIVPAQHAFVRTGDVNGDGLTDLVSWRGPPFANAVSVELGLGSATFESPVQVYGSSVDALGVGDLDANGADDLVMLGVTDNVLYGQVGGLPGAPQPLSVGLGPDEAIRMADVDDDGRLDLVKGGGALLGINLQLAGGGFGSSADTIYSGTGAGVQLMAIGDVDLDGRLDVVTGRSMGSLLTVLTGQGDGGFHPIHSSPAIGFYFDALTADFDLDGRLDLLGAWAATDSHVQLLRKGGIDMSFAAPVEVPVGLEAIQLHVSEVSGDGIPDVLALEAGASSQPARVSVTTGHGDLTFAPPVVTVVASSSALGDFVDFNADGLTDVVLVGKTSGNQMCLSMLRLERGAFVLDSTLVFSLGAAAVVDVIARDIDENGTTDVVLSCQVPAIVQVLSGVPGGGFLGPTTLADVSGVWSIELADMNQDGHLDLVGTHSGADDSAVFVHAGHGNGVFDPPSIYPAETSPGALLVDDVNDDGLPDVLVRTKPDDEGSGIGIRLFHGLPEGGLEFVVFQPTAQSARSLHLADIDRDGRQDLIIALFQGPFESSHIVVCPNANGPWKNLTHSLAGTTGFSKLVGEGTLQPGSPKRFHVVHGPPLKPVFFVAGLTALNAPFKGGTLVPQPSIVVPLGATNGDGELHLSGTWPASIPHGTSIFVQAWFANAGGPAGFAATNGVIGTSP